MQSAKKITRVSNSRGERLFPPTMGGTTSATVIMAKAMIDIARYFSINAVSVETVAAVV